MAQDIFPPTTLTNILVNTRTSSRIVYLPTVSTFGAGKLYFIKDICGNAANSSIFISTTGLDVLENSRRGSTLYGLMSTNFQSVLLASDGLLNWMILQNYNTNVIPRRIPPVPVPVLPQQANLIVDLRGLSYSAGGATWTNSVDSSTWAMTNTTYDATYGGPIFNGSSTFAYRSSVTNWSGSTFTIVCFYYKSSTATNGQLTTINRTGGNTTNQLYLQENSVFEYSNQFGYNFTPTVTTNTVGLFMLSWVKNGTTGTFYRNASANGTRTASVTVTIGNGDFCIGKDFRDNNNFLAGTIKRYLIYRVALTAAEISTVYSVLSTSSSAPTIFSYTGSAQNFVVPSGVSEITVYMWGAGGGGGGGTDGGTYSAGAGAYITGNLSVTPGETLTIIIGLGGTLNQTTAGTLTQGGGGAAGSPPNNCGSGGGRSAIQRPAGTDIVVAGGGSGGGWRQGAAATSSGTSNPGTSVNGANGGGGGTQTTGGAAGAVSGYSASTAGSKGQGGNGGGYASGGGGGWFGGGGGGVTAGNGGTGGAGSSYIDLLISPSGINGSVPAAPATTSPYYGGSAAVGGQSGATTGGNGRIVIVY
jgi:hypothetical protein